MKLSPNAFCPCGRGLKYKKCCGALHRGQPPATLEDLMRSRYTAYAVGNVRYIMQTTHPHSPFNKGDTGEWAAQLEIFCKMTDFEKLEVLSSEVDEAHDVGWVTFRATMFQGKKDISALERSLFRRLNGRWLYVSPEPEQKPGG